MEQVLILHSGTTENRKRAAREMLTREVKELMSRQPQEGLRWAGTKTDLIEALHIAYVQGSIIDRQGRPCTFRHIISRVCDVLHVSAPANPSSYASRASCRKGTVQPAFIERYVWQFYEEGISRPLQERIQKGSGALASA